GPAVGCQTVAYSRRKAKRWRLKRPRPQGRKPLQRPRGGGRLLPASLPRPAAGRPPRGVAMKSPAFDPALRRVRALCLALPEACEVAAWGHPTFRAGKKMFAAFGGEDGGLSLGLKVGHDRQEQLLEDARFFPTPYAAHQGWVSLRIDGQTD